MRVTGPEGYERLRALLFALPAAEDSAVRKVLWVGTGERLGVARDELGRLEIFVAGQRLVANVPAVRDSVEHQVWKTSSALELPANRIVLPSAPHFDSLGAFVCSELIENGVYDDYQAAFNAVEPTLALILTRLRLSDEVLVGLAGELALLEILVKRVSSNLAETIVSGWAGSVPSARDMQLGTVGVEVKTTTGVASVHHVQGVHQVELGHPNAGGVETQLFLLSIGLVWGSESGSGTRIPALIDSILSHLPHHGHRRDFLARLRQYGGDASIGYVHERDHEKERFARPFSFSFERLYDLTDPVIRLPRTSDLLEYSELEVSSVRFRIKLRDRVRGDLNPVTGWSAIADQVLLAAGYPG